MIPFATIYLNGEELGRHHNMFREDVFDVGAPQDPLLWQPNDCWPVLSWSVLDYHGSGKAGYYYARRAYSPILASFKAMRCLKPVA